MAEAQYTLALGHEDGPMVALVGPVEGSIWADEENVDFHVTFGDARPTACRMSRQAAQSLADALQTLLDATEGRSTSQSQDTPLSADQMDDVVQWSLHPELYARRQLMTAGLPSAFVANIAGGSPIDLFRQDLHAVNNWTLRSSSGQLFLDIWLQNAARLTSYLPVHKKFEALRREILGRQP